MSNSEKRRRRANRRQAISILVGLVVLAAGFYLYAERVKTSELVQLEFERADGSRTQTLYLELAETREEHSKGLMYRTRDNFPEDRGMLFVYRDFGPKTFWMKNTYLSLDMIFLDMQNKVVGFLENVPALTLDSRSIDQPSRYVLEFNAGAVARLRISKGDKAHFSRPDL